MLDSSQRCGPNQEIYGQTERCVCVANAAFTPAGCVLCGADEVPGATGCECAPGLTRVATGACEVVAPGPGAPCSATMPCTDAIYNHCATDGYCTNAGCTGGDCSTGYECDLSGATSYCKLSPPVGLGMSCTSNADCAGTQATYCDTFMSHSCLVEGCSVSPDNCYPGWDCCDLRAFGVPMPICIPAGACQQ